MKKRYALFTLFIAIVAIASCAHTNTTSEESLQPMPPKENSLDMRPPLDSLGRPLPPPEGFEGEMRPPLDSLGRPLPPPKGGLREQNASLLGKVGSAGLLHIDGNAERVDITYMSDLADQNVVQQIGGSLELDNCHIEKLAGNCSNSDASSFFGINSAVYVAGKGSVMNIAGGDIYTSAKGANACFAYNGGVLNISKTKIRCKDNLSRGIHATGGGEIYAYDLDVATLGNNSSVIATDRGGGKVMVDRGSYVCKGKDCAVVYSTGDIVVENATGESLQGEVCVVEGDNYVKLVNCNMKSGSSKRGIMILQSGSGDARGKHGRVYIEQGSIELTNSAAPLVDVPTNATGSVTITDASLVIPSRILMRVAYNSRWKTRGGKGNLVLASKHKHTYEGTVIRDADCTLNVTIQSGATWRLTANTTLDTLTVEPGGAVDLNGYKLITKARNDM